MSIHKKYRTIERLDQGHLYPLGRRRQTCHGRGANLRPPVKANALPKELSRQLISWLFGASTWPSSMTTFGPLHGRPSAYAKHMDLNWEVGRIALASAAALNVHQALCKSACFESRRGHHYRETWPGSSLSSRYASRQTRHGRGANLRPPAEQANALPKELSRQLISWLFWASTWPSSMTTFGPLQYLLNKNLKNIDLQISSGNRLQYVILSENSREIKNLPRFLG